MREASKSFVPLFRCGFGSVGPCHQSSFSVPPPPRFVGLKALAAEVAELAAAAAGLPAGACVAAPALAARVAAPPAFLLFPELLDPQAASTLAITGIVRPAANILAMKCRREIRPALKSSASSATVQSDIGWHLLRPYPPRHFRCAESSSRRIRRQAWPYPCGATAFRPAFAGAAPYVHFTVAKRDCGPISLDAQARVQKVPQPVADGVHRQHGEHDRHAGKGIRPPGAGDDLALPRGDHVPPGRRRRRHGEAEER